MLNNILELFGLNAAEYQVVPFGSGLINNTWKVCGEKNYILQRINDNVFTNPDAIAENLNLLKEYFSKTAPDYLFVAPLATPQGQIMVKAADGGYYRLFPFIENSVTLTEIENPHYAYEAARQFGHFTCLLNEFDCHQLNYTLTQFHDLQLRFDQFTAACSNAQTDRLLQAAEAIRDIHQQQEILFTYQKIMRNNELPLRVIHHDTKISNVLFDTEGNGLCVIDLDTVMPGYFLSDVGDMMRTYLSPANEEETDLSRIEINEECFYAICKGYFGAMQTVLTPHEKQYFVYSGKYMIYMQAIRFLTDFLNGDIYYGSAYPKQNLFRAQNQLTLLHKYLALECKFQAFVDAGHEPQSDEPVVAIY